MESQRSGPYHPMSMVSVETTVTGPNQKKRKSGSLFSSLKFWKRKDKNNTRSLPPISRPTEFQHLSGTSSRLVGATVEKRYQKARSLPQSITRHSALGSHAPFEDVALEKQVESDVEPSIPHKTLQRRATLPNMASNHDDHPFMDARTNFLDDGKMLDPADIGFAVTSGANFLKRRSRSADALYAASLQQEAAPPPPPTGPWKHERRRSDDIRYWRASVCPLPMCDTREDAPIVQEYRKQPAVRSSPKLEEPLPVEQTVEASDHPIPVATKEPGSRVSFDFGGFATTIHQQENTSIEDRVMTVEVKLMDLEYAVSRLQSSSAIATSESPRIPDSHILPGGHESLSTSQRSHTTLEDSVTARSISTQPTNASIGTASEDAQSSSGKPQNQHLETSTSTSASASQSAPIPIPIPTANPPFRLKSATTPNTTTTTTNDINPNTINNNHHSSPTLDPNLSSDNISHDQLTSLLGLIRREQASRHRLEDQIVHLQREVKTLRQHVMLPSLASSPYPPGTAIATAGDAKGYPRSPYSPSSPPYAPGSPPFSLGSRYVRGQASHPWQMQMQMQLQRNAGARGGRGLGAGGMGMDLFDESETDDGSHYQDDEEDEVFELGNGHGLALGHDRGLDLGHSEKLDNEHDDVDDEDGDDVFQTPTDVRNNGSASGNGNGNRGAVEFEGGIFAGGFREGVAF